MEALMAGQPLKFAVIGLGMASKPHLSALLQLADSIEVAGVYARNADRRKEVSDNWGWPQFESLEEIAASDIDATLIITPPNARINVVRTIAASGKAILMEKPVERDLKRATELVEICEIANVPLGIVLQHRFRAGAEAMTTKIHSGEVGDVLSVRATLPWWREQSYYDQPGRGTYAKDGGGVLITQAIHVLDLMLSLTGPAHEVVAMTGRTKQHQMEAENFATAGIRFENGAIGAVIATTASFPGHAEMLELDCERASMRLIAGELTVHWRDGRVETVGDLSGTGGGKDPMDFPCDWHRDLIQDFAMSLKAGTPPRVSGRAALEVHRLIDAIEKAARSGNISKVRSIV